MVHSSGVDQSGEFSRSTRAVERVPVQLDLNHDNVVDWIVPKLPAADQLTSCPQDVVWEIYASAGACWRQVGAIAGEWVAGSDGTHNGLVDLSSTTVITTVDRLGGVPTRTERESSYRFDGEVYRESAARRTEGVCHHCAVWHCELVGRAPAAVPSDQKEK